MHQPAPHRFYRFGPNVLDCLRGVLWQDGVQVPLTPRVFDILSTLVQHEGELVTKDDFMRLVWGGVAVEDNNLARQISTLRKLLHERPGQREYIATVTGVGYRFVGAVTASDELPDALMTPVGSASASPAPMAHLAPAESVAALAPDVSPAPTAPLAPDVPPSRADGPVPVAQMPPAAASPWGAILLGTAALVALLGLLLWPDQRTDAAPVSRTLWQFTHGSGSQFDPAWSPDGTRLALASDRNGNSDIWVYGVADAAAVQLTTSIAHDGQPHWSPDGRSIVFRSERNGGGIYIVPATGGTERRLTTFGSSPRWSPRGDAILFTQTAPASSVAVKLFVVDTSGGAPRRVTHPAMAGLQVTSAAWTPDGRVSIWTRDEIDNRQFLTFSLDGGPATISAIPREFSTMSAPTQLTSFVWAPSGRHIYFEGRTRAVRNVWRVTVDPTTLDWSGGPEQITLGPGADVGLAVSPDGARLSFGVNTARPGIWSFGFEPRTGRIAADGEQVISGASGERGADVTSDGRRVVYRLDRDNRQEIWDRQLDGEPQLLVSDTGWDVSVPKWSPDHRRIVYQRRSRSSPGVAERRSVVMLDVMDPERRPVEILRIPAGHEALPTDWRADGRAILTACRTQPEDRVGICELSLPDAAGQAGDADMAGGAGTAGESKLTRLAVNERLSLYQQRYSPNQRWVSFIAVARADRSASTVYVMPGAGGPWRPMTDGQAYDDKPRWSPDGRILYYISNRDGRFEVWGRRFDPDAGVPQGEAFRVTALEGARLTLSPYLTDMEMFVTRDRIFLPLFEASSRIWMLDQVDR